jgi:hypothetical protein
MKNKGAKQKLKRKGATSAFGCDLTEYLESSGQDGNVPSSPPPSHTHTPPFCLRQRWILLGCVGFGSQVNVFQACALTTFFFFFFLKKMHGSYGAQRCHPDVQRG